MNSRRWVQAGAAIYVAILVVVVAALILLYRGSRDRLDESLGQRLIAIAVTATELVDAEQVLDWSIDPEETIEFLWLTTRLEEIQRANNLAEVSLCDGQGFGLISASRRLERGELNPFWELDREAVDLALGGFAAASRLYRSGTLYQKSAHAPIFDPEGEVVAVITVEAAVDFFDTLATLRQGALSTGGIVIAFLVLSGLALIRLQRAQALYRTRLAEQENLAAMGRMTAGIAHEIRNPLGVIRGTGQHLQNRLRSAGIEDPVADFIPEEVDRLDRILSSYLALGSGADVEPEKLDLAEVVQRTMKLMASDLEKFGVTVTCDSVDLPVMGDRHRLQQVLMNLLLNARDAMPDGGAIEIRGVVLASQAVLTITDEGHGVEGDPESLFVAFETTREKGSGLGLAVSRQITEAHGGVLTIESRTDRAGAVATLSLPVAGSEA
jgi:signal transduction histidine kinase